MSNQELENFRKEGESKMKNSLADLNNILFEQIERLNDDEIMMGDNETADAERKRAKAISGVAKQIIENARVQLDAFKHFDEFNIKTSEVPEVLENKKRKLIGGK